MLKQWLIIGVITALVLFAAAAVIRWRLKPRKKVKPERFMKRWKNLQELCAHKETWPEAIIEADKLLNDVLKKKHFKGSGMGERLVSAHKLFTDSDSVWFAHKLANKLGEDKDLKLKESDVKEALLGIGRGLRDLGVLRKKAVK